MTRTGALLSLLIIALAFFGQAAHAGARIDLDGAWRFQTDPGDAGLSARWPDAAPEGARVVTIPHTWNLGPNEAYDGLAWYFRTVTLPPELAGRHIELNFGATFYKSRVFVNGVEVGGHEGGFTAYHLDVGKQLRAGENRIAVAIDNRPGFATIPGYAMRLQASGSVWYDWWRNGGVLRDVWLDVADEGQIRGQTIRQRLSGDRATAVSRIAIENVDSASHAYGVAARLEDPEGRVVARAERRVEVAGGGAAEPVVELEVLRPQLWNVGAAKLYRLTVELRDETGRLLDTRTDAIGFRQIEIKDRRLYVNGSPVRLTGMTRHQDSPWEGQAESAGTIRRDWNDLAALHVALTRPVHYPQPQAVLDEADRNGMLLIPEIPIWQMTEAQLADPRLLALAKRMMSEMIAEAGNHPSVLAWSLMNESDASKPGGLAFFRALKAHVRAVDPGRLVTFADSDVTITWKPAQALREADFVMANAYFGTWSGGADAVDAWLDFFDKTYPDKMLVISEFGWPGPFSADPKSADAARAENLLGQLAAFEKRDFVSGAIFWTYQDYHSSRNLYAGSVDGYVDHGVVDENRQRKPSYAVWEQRNRVVDVSVGWTVGEGGLKGFVAKIASRPAGALPSYPVLGAKVRWKALDQNGAVIAQSAPRDLDLAKPISVTGAWDKPVNGLVRLSVDVLAANGVRAGGQAIDYRPFALGAAPFPPEASQLPSSPAVR
ncbi:glycoside hydrolase family 2 TIM barrel-domain containing protein [Caulobacter segnis]|uniref:glycoside hydrolase family 2 protein n=1 Tax=Caulobacter segnis TaxID=88688 RepID=UPI00285C33AA|nr:glycoside hydrolase family 2 TIM barrel-domain containing protein [Caulobacter segnis]MDR6625894.1 beta-galactosidase/beta-glucuronidase [Caulobacter segnis]